ncbi:cytochrome c oxidase subunit 3 [Penaeicola halotolerans]|uniref:cytochrome c oxidase subunit 3 n=1 Tax=Penaeicola halotolerans TaxID=2793196 RepID=UPI001CF8EDF5|nr:cytochrome c oxidase subunit 3 [Penaeicola halotolerans]
MSIDKINTVEEAEQPLSMHPQKFALWLFIVTVVMLFAAMTSAYIVRQGEGNWLIFDLPTLFYVNSGIIILSSATMHWAYTAAQKDNLGQVKLAMWLTTVLGFAFLVGQWEAWGVLVDADLFFVGSNISASFLYVITGLHAVHLISGVIFLIIVLISSYKYKVHSKNMTRMEMCVTYWHFLGGLWIYLFVFLLLNH